MLVKNKENELQRVKYIDNKSSDVDIIKTLTDFNIVGSVFSSTSAMMRDNNLPWYKGNPKENVGANRSKVRSNRIFISCETIVPMVTAKPARPSVTDKKTAKSKAEGMLLEKLHQKTLTSLYKELKIKKELQKVVRQWFIYGCAFLKYGVDNDNKIVIKNVKPYNILMDPYALSVDDATFIGEKIQISVNDLVDKYPNKADYIYDFVGGKDFGFTLLEIKEFWVEDNFFVIHNDKEVLYKGKNPLYYWGEKTYDDYGEEIYDDKNRNYFCSSKKPYVSFRVYDMGDEFRDFTTMLEQAIPLQENYNRRLRQIDDNAEKTANAILMGQNISDDELNDFNNRKEAGDAVPLEPGQNLAYTQSPGLPNYIISSVQLLLSEIDNVMSTQNTVRGDGSGSETATGRQILAQSAQDRHGGSLGVAVEEMFTDLYKAITHLINVFYEVEDLVPYLGLSDSEKYFKFLRDTKNDGLQIDVVAGSTLPDDKLYKKAEAMELLSAGKITDEELYTRLGWDNPKEAADALKLEAVKAQQLAEESQKRTAMGNSSIESGQNNYQDLMGKIQQLGQK